MYSLNCKTCSNVAECLVNFSDHSIKYIYNPAVSNTFTQHNSAFNSTIMVNIS